jgi:glycerol-3-phosphate dehydrogenase (NAD(P)+)
MKVAVIGDGGWGTALAMVLQRNGHAVRVWGPFADYIDSIRRAGENTKFLPGVELPKDIAWCEDRKAAVEGAEVVVLASPSRFFAEVVESFAPLMPSVAHVVSVAKGLSKDGHQRMTELAATLLDHPHIAALSGPSHAEEVARGVPSAVAIACDDLEVAAALQEVFTAPTFRVYTTDDVVGVELGGALKNVIALAAGVSDGLGYGDNTKAALVTRGLAETIRLGTAMGARPATFAGLSGIGDLMVTCASRLSRNRAVGERLGRGETLAEILDHMDQVAEGVWTSVSARLLARDHGVEVPITDEVYAIAHEGKDPREAVQSLLARDPKSEVDAGG